VFLDEASVKDGLLEVIEEAYIPKGRSTQQP
jgi:hypothetical protein